MIRGQTLARGVSATSEKAGPPWSQGAGTLVSREGRP